ALRQLQLHAAGWHRSECDRVWQRRRGRPRHAAAWRGAECHRGAVGERSGLLDHRLTRDRLDFRPLAAACAAVSRCGQPHPAGPACRVGTRFTGRKTMLEALLAAPFVLALIVALAHRMPRGVLALLTGVAPLFGLLVLGSISPEVMQGEIVRGGFEWIPQVGLDFSLRIDGLAWMFAGLVLGIGLLIVLYAHYYLSPNDSAPRFFAFLLLFMGSMLGMVIAGNLLL